MKSLLLSFVLIFAVTFDARADEPLRVVTTLTVFSDIVRSIGGELVEVHAVARPKFNAHFIEPRPSDVRRVQEADLFVHSGLDYEPWRFSLTDAAGNPELRPGGKREVDASKGVTMLELPAAGSAPSRSEGDIHIFGNPHYTLAPGNAGIIIRTIATALSTAAPSHREAFDRRRDALLGELEERLSAWNKLASVVRGTKAVGYHNEWVYLTDYLGVDMSMFLEDKPGIPPSPKHLIEVERYVKENRIRALVSASFYSLDPLESVAEATGAKVVVLCQNVEERAECKDYLSLLDYNIRTLAAVLSEKQ